MYKAVNITCSFELITIFQMTSKDAGISPFV